MKTAAELINELIQLHIFKSETRDYGARSQLQSEIERKIKVLDEVLTKPKLVNTPPNL